MYDVRCKFEAFEVEFNDYLAVEIQLYNVTIPLLDLFLAWWPSPLPLDREGCTETPVLSKGEESQPM